MLRLRKHIRRRAFRVRALVGDDEYLARTGYHIDVDLSVNELFRRGDIDVARSRDLIDGGNCLRAVSERRDRLRAADFEYLRHARYLRRGEYFRLDPALFGGSHHNDLFHARHRRGDGVHQNGRRISRRTAGHIDAHALERRDLLTEDHPVFLFHLKALRDLAPMKIGDVLRRLFHHLQQKSVALRRAFRPFAFAHGHLARPAVEFERIFSHRLVAPLFDVLDDRGDARRDARVGVHAADKDVCSPFFVVFFNLYHQAPLSRA